MIYFLIVLIMFLVGLNGFFVVAEFVIVKVRRARIEALIMEGNTWARYARNIIQNLDAYLSATQLGVTLASLGLGWGGEPAVAAMIKPALSEIGLSDQVIQTISFTLAFSLITAVHIVLGELAPKSLAIQMAEGISLWTAVALTGFYKIMYPFIRALNEISNSIIRAFGIEIDYEQQSAHTEEEIRILMEESHKQEDHIAGFIHRKDLLSAAARGQRPNIRDLCAMSSPFRNRWQSAICSRYCRRIGLNGRRLSTNTAGQ